VGRHDAQMAMSAARQRNAVSEGMALGLVMQGRTTLPFDKVAVDLAFEGAWRGWEYASRFSQVSTDLRNGSDGVWVMTHASETKRTVVLFWDRDGRELAIYTRLSDWDPGDDDEVDYALRMIDGDVPLEGWVALARRFLERLDD
jgi:hypothetical protein